MRDRRAGCRLCPSAVTVTAPCWEEKFRIPSAGNESRVSPTPGEPTEGTDARPGLTAPSGFYVVLVRSAAVPQPYGMNRGEAFGKTKQKTY